MVNGVAKGEEKKKSSQYWYAMTMRIKHGNCLEMKNDHIIPLSPIYFAAVAAAIVATCAFFATLNPLHGAE